MSRHSHSDEPFLYMCISISNLFSFTSIPSSLIVLACTKTYALDCIIDCSYLFSLGDASKDCQRFVDAIVLISAPDWSKRLLNFQNVVQTLAFERRTMLEFAKLLFDTVLFLGFCYSICDQLILPAPVVIPKPSQKFSCSKIPEEHFRNFQIIFQTSKIF